MRIFDSSLRQAALQPVQVLLDPERPLVVRRDHFVDAVAEDEAAIQHRDAGALQRHIVAVQVAQAVVVNHRFPRWCIGARRRQSHGAIAPGFCLGPQQVASRESLQYGQPAMKEVVGPGYHDQT